MKSTANWIIILISGVIVTGAITSSKPQQNSTPVQQAQTKTDTKETEVDFISKTVDDNTLYIGDTKTVQDGVKGKKVQTYEVTYTDSNETSRKLVKEETTVPPTDKVVANGTKVKVVSNPPLSPVKTYTNSAGNSVQSPTYYNAAPAGASALCGDGTYSFSQSSRGTCSHHGGVAEWL